MKLTKDRLKQIIKEELEETYNPYDPYDREKEINARLGREDFQSQPTRVRVRNISSVPFKSAPTPLGNKIVPIINDMKFNFDKNETPEAKKTRQENVEKIRILGDLVFSLERGENSEKLNNLLKQVQEKGGVSKVLELIKDQSIKTDIQNLLSNKGIQENMKLTRDKLKQIIKEELEETMLQQNEDVTGSDLEGDLRTASQIIKSLKHQLEISFTDIARKDPSTVETYRQVLQPIQKMIQDLKLKHPHIFA